MGDRSAYTGFKFGDLSWQDDQSKPVGVNPKGSTISDVNVDGVILDDARRCGEFIPSIAPCKTNYMWEGLQGAVAAAELLHRAGYPAFEYSDRAILRAIEWLHNTTFSDGKTTPQKAMTFGRFTLLTKDTIRISQQGLPQQRRLEKWSGTQTGLTLPDFDTLTGLNLEKEAFKSRHRSTLNSSSRGILSFDVLAEA
jgi:hypothetical protein